MSNRDLDKLNEQIDSLLREDPTRQVIVDRKYAYDDIKDETRRIDDLSSFEEELEEEYEEVEEKKLSRVARLEEEGQYPKNNHKEKEIEEDDDQINYPLLIVGAIFFVVVFACMIVFFVYF